MDQSHQVDVIFIDFQKAFDKIPYQRLLTKLHHYGIQGKIHEWLNIWLTKSIQRVVINGHESNFTKVQSGVPQGAVLGPLIFLFTSMILIQVYPPSYNCLQITVFCIVPSAFQMTILIYNLTLTSS